MSETSSYHSDDWTPNTERQLKEFIANHYNADGSVIKLIRFKNEKGSAPFLSKRSKESALRKFISWVENGTIKTPKNYDAIIQQAKRDIKDPSVTVEVLTGGKYLATAEDIHTSVNYLRENLGQCFPSMDVYAAAIRWQEQLGLTSQEPEEVMNLMGAEIGRLQNVIQYLHDANNTLQMECDAEKDKYGKHMSVVSQQRDEYEHQMHILKATLDKQCQELQAMEKERFVADDQTLEKLQAELDALKIKNKQVQGEMDAMTNQLQAITLSNEELLSKSESLNEQLDRAVAECQSLKGQLDSATTESQSLKEQLRSGSGEMKTLQKKVSEMALLQHELASTRLEKEGLRRSEQELARANESLSRQIASADEARERCYKLEEELATTKQESQTEMLQLVEKLDIQKAYCDGLENKLIAAKKANQARYLELVENLDAERAHRDGLESKLTAAEQENHDTLNEMIKKLDDEKVRCNTLKNDSIKLSAAYRSISKQATRDKHKLAKLKNTVEQDATKLGLDLNRYKNLYKSSESERKTLAKKYESLKQEESTLKKNYDELRETVGSLFNKIKA